MILSRMSLLGWLGVVASGCITVGKPVQTEKLDRIVPCRSTESDVIALMGEPYERGRSLTYHTLRYVYARGAMFTRPSRQDLLIYVNKKGVVVDFVLNPIAQVISLPDRCEEGK